VEDLCLWKGTTMVMVVNTGTLETLIKFSCPKIHKPMMDLITVFPSETIQFVHLKLQLRTGMWPECIFIFIYIELTLFLSIKRHS